jgi:hypothetical protein
MVMIKKQYNRFDFGSYFNNFVAHNMATDPDSVIEDALRPYQATVGKSKNKHSKLNVKWHDETLYIFFVLKWS